MTMNLLTIKNFSKSYTDKVLFSNADFSINTKEKIGVIGVNGTGKSTLLKIIAGIDTCDSGQFSKGNNVVIRYLPQTPDFTEAVSIYDYVITANSAASSAMRSQCSTAAQSSSREPTTLCWPMRPANTTNCGPHRRSIIPPRNPHKWLPLWGSCRAKRDG